jgi:hypothetical protein
LSDSNGHLFPFQSSQASKLYEDTFWLKPGERRHFYFNIENRLETAGVYEIRARFANKGECRMLVEDQNRQPFPTKKFPADRQTAGDDPVALFECWSGDVRSDLFHLSVSEPANDIDRQALAHFKKMTGLRGGAFARVFPYLIENYPESYYTYVAGYHRDVAGGNGKRQVLQEMMTLQPNHPLSTYMKFYAAEKTIHIVNTKGRREYIEGDIPDIKPTDLGLPPAMVDYLVEYKAIKESEYRLSLKENTAKNRD